MVGSRKRRDNNLIDAIEAIEPVEFSGSVWRVVGSGKNPVQCSRSGGRWDDGTFDVLYTSEKRKGAIEEMRFHLLRGQPVIPSQVRYRLFEIELALDRSLKLLDIKALAAIGLDTSRFGQLSYQERKAEYPRSQDIGEVAQFLDFDGLVVPNARYKCCNVVAFCELVKPSSLAVASDHGEIDWAQS